MSAPAFTAGPWVVADGYIRTARGHHGEDGIGVASIEFMARPAAERDANAALMASAPEMFEALVRAQEMICSEICMGEGHRAVCRIASAALLKARGGK